MHDDDMPTGPAPRPSARRGAEVPKPFDQTNGVVDFDSDQGDDGSAERLRRIVSSGVITHGFLAR